MRYGVIPTRLAERFALWFGRVPLPIADSLLPLVQTRALMAAVRLGVVDAMANGAASAGDIARRCDLDADSVEMLLRVLVSAEYVTMSRGGSERRHTRYGLSPLGRRTLLVGAPDEARGYLLFNYVQWELIEHLEEVVRSGRGVDMHDTMSGKEPWKWYQDAMLCLARAAAPVLARMVPVKGGARTLVDIGGSHGLLGAAICRRHPPMRSIVLELAAAIDEARAAARKAGVDDIVQHCAANVLEDDLPPNADVVLLANILHHVGRDEAVRLLVRVRAAMTAGATAAIWEFDRPAADSPPELAADAAALYFHLTSTSQVVPGDEYAAYLREAGFGEVRTARSALAPFQVLAVGLK